MERDFCVFVISYRRAKNVQTLRTLDRAGYTGPSYVVVDNKDPELAAYRARYGDRLLVFSKDAVAERIDLGDNFEGQQTPLYAREKVWDFADELGVEYFMVLDDDYDYFRHRINERGAYSTTFPWVRDLDMILSAMMRYMDEAEITCLAFSQGGDWIGGRESTGAGIKAKRKVMQTFLCKTDRYFDFFGRLNDDVNTYVLHGLRGRLMFTYMPVSINQGETQQNEGGITEAYLEFGTYTKSFYTVMYAPSCTTVSIMGMNHKRLHHRISWRNAAPKILRDKHRK